ncbi:MAG: long-chain fatty acid--CoA ligase [Acidobacteria bacterium]|nr:long-chain fatty acid--CoA ligase [Acidobacteriota bacterium]
MTEKTILDFYRHEVDTPREKHYFHYFPGGSRSMSTEEFFRRTSAFASALKELGVKKQDRVMLLSDNRPEWHMVDLAVADLGATLVPIYGTLTPEQVTYQAKDSGASFAVVENAEQMNKFLKAQQECPNLTTLVQMEGEHSKKILDFDELISASGGQDNEARFWDRAAEVSSDDLLTLIYTSGTTGEPKGVMLTHQNLVENVLASADRAPVQQDWLALEFLPLCHVLERMVGYILMYRAASKAYCSVYHVGDLIADIGPQIFTGVPRFYEKVHDKVMEAVNGAPAIRQSLFHWAIGVGKKAAYRRFEGKPSHGLSYLLADKLVLSKVRAAIGGRVEVCISGGAPLPLHVNEFFHSIGVYVIEGYGLTETSPVISVNGTEPGTIKLGTVGLPLRNLDVRIAPDGELIVKGPSVMKGYWNKPEKTKEVFDEDGYFHTGDIAVIDQDGFVKITDRKKDLIVTAGGKNVAPQPIESLIKKSQFVDTVVLIGDRRRFIIALVSPNEEELKRWAKNQGISFESLEELTRHPKAHELYQGVFDEVNAGLARYEQVKKFAILPVTLSIEGGQLTPTLKVKRRVVEKEFKDVIDALYEE